MRVQDVMHSGVTCVDDDTSVREIARIMREEDIGAVPVTAEGEIVGMITDRDLACRVLGDGADPDSITARQVMSGRPIFCSPRDDVEDAIEVMESNRIRRLPVMDEEELVGMLSLGDISNRVRQELAGEVLRCVSAHHT
jgi:CBS domain-containing protein